jgi:HAD superfamily hydrolase (TIGR01490 family)
VAIAYFDLDRTLIAANSAVLWLRSELRLGHISRLTAGLASLWVARYRLGFAGRGDGLRLAIASLAGRPAASLRERTSGFYQEHVQGRYRPGALDALQTHRARGDKVALLSSSSSFLGDLVAAELGMDEVLCNRFEVDARGDFTGRPEGELCYGAGKWKHARGHARSKGFDLEQCAFYTDSYADLALLRAVGRPVAVNPDLRLRREATFRRWEIVDWGLPPQLLARSGQVEFPDS